ncbi:MAG TPA: tyrosine-type recombinase/integrase, partial [Beijerinckiaceae bacterium]|nr:tyrosine-type recombinase/integrase [Beijerinckiaceae bacterium]
VYAYDRRTGTRLTPPHALYAPEWFAALAAARKAAPAAEKPGTFGALVHAYRDSPRFKQEIAPRTRADYLRVLDWLQPLHDAPLHKFTRGFVAALRDKAQDKRGRRFANYVLAVVSVVFSFGVERELADQNPVAGVKKVRRSKTAPRANRPWAAEEWAAVTAAAEPHLLAPILLGGLLGYREGEALSAQRTSWNRRTGVLERISAKSGKEVRVPAPQAVADALAALQPHDATTLLVNSRGRPWTENGFRSSFFKLIGRLEADGKIGPNLTFHGLRHTVATRMRELGYDKDTIADMLGQATPGMAAHYSREADLAPKLRGVVKKLERKMKR